MLERQFIYDNLYPKNILLYNLSPLCQTAYLSEMLFCNQAVSQMKHNIPVFLFLVRKKEASNTTALIKANVSANCERPYLELLGSKGEKERHSVRQRERQQRQAEKYISNILMLTKGMQIKLNLC